MIYLLQGEEEFEKSEKIRDLKGTLGELGTLNLTELQGRQLERAQLQHHCETLPFLTDLRMVFVYDLLVRLTGAKSGSGDAAYLDWLVDYLPTIPPSTCLVFVESKGLSARSRIVKTISGLQEKGIVQSFTAPSPKRGELADWVSRRAKLKGAVLERGVASDLANFIGPDLRLIDSELEKLAIYAGDRPISHADIRSLVPYAQEASIFDLVDALGHRQTSQAFRLLTRLRHEGAHPLYLLSMIVRQFRIILQVKDCAGRGMDQNSIATALGYHPFPTGKAMKQAAHYSPPQLERIYDRLLQTDVAIKTGKMEAELALDLLVVELARAT